MIYITRNQLTVYNFLSFDFEKDCLNFLMCINVMPACMYVHIIHTGKYPWILTDSVGCTRTGVAGSSESPCGFWKWKLGAPNWCALPLPHFILMITVILWSRNLCYATYLPCPNSQLLQLLHEAFSIWICLHNVYIWKIKFLLLISIKVWFLNFFISFK